MDSMPAHQPLLEDDTDEELNDEQVRELLNEAAQRMRAKAALQPVTSKKAPFRLPKLKHDLIADTYEKTDGSITRLDQSKLVDKKQQALANSIKKIDDPLLIKKQKKEVCTSTILLYQGSGTETAKQSSWQLKLSQIIVGCTTTMLHYSCQLATVSRPGPLPVMISIPNFILSRLGPRLGCLPAKLRFH